MNSWDSDNSSLTHAIRSTAKVSFARLLEELEPEERASVIATIQYLEIAIAEAIHKESIDKTRSLPPSIKLGMAS